MDNSGNSYMNELNKVLLENDDKVLMLQPLNGVSQLLVFTERGRIFNLWLLPPSGDEAMIRETSVIKWDDEKGADAAKWIQEQQMKMRAAQQRGSAAANGIVVPEKGLLVPGNMAE